MQLLNTFEIDRVVSKLDDRLFCYGYWRHNELWMYLVLIAIYNRLSNLSSSPPININNSSSHDKTNAKDESLVQFDNKLNAMTKLLSKIYLDNLCFSQRCLQLFSDIITICKHKLTYIDIEFKLSKSSNATDHYQVKNSVNSVSANLAAIYQQQFGEITDFTHVNDSKTDDTQINSAFNIIMNKISKLPKLNTFRVNLRQFPISCYDYYKHFNFTNNNITFNALESFSLQLGYVEMATHIDSIKDSLYNWIIHHDKVTNIDIKIKNFLATFGSRRKERAITYRQRENIKLLVIKFIEGIINNVNLCKRLEGFSFSDELMGIRDYKNILIKLFDCKLLRIHYLDLTFNDMRDIYLKEIIDKMIQSEYICNSLCFLSLDWNCTYMQWIQWSYAPETRHWLEERPDFLCIDDQLNICKYFDDILGDTGVSEFGSKIEQAIEEFRSIHYAKYSINSLIEFIEKCKYMDNLQVTCYDGMNIEHTKQLIQVISNHGLIDDLYLRALQCNDEICDILCSLFVNKYSFIQVLEVMFSDNRMFKRTLTGKALENLISIVVNNSDSFCEKYIASVNCTLSDVGFATDIVKIIIGYLFNWEDKIEIELTGLDNSLKRSSKCYFDDMIAKISPKRKIQYNDDVDIIDSE